MVVMAIMEATMEATMEAIMEATMEAIIMEVGFISPNNECHLYHICTSLFQDMDIMDITTAATMDIIDILH